MEICHVAIADGSVWSQNTWNPMPIKLVLLVPIFGPRFPAFPSPHSLYRQNARRSYVLRSRCQCRCKQGRYYFLLVQTDRWLFFRASGRVSSWQVRLSLSPLLLGTHDRSAFSAFGGILFGYDTGVISGIKEIHPWLEIFGQQTADGSFILPSNHDSLVTSILSAGTFFGALLGAPVGDYLGRKWVRLVVIRTLYLQTTEGLYRAWFSLILFSVLALLCKVALKVFLSS